MKYYVLPFLVINILFISCSSPNITRIANELCQCKTLSPQEAEFCFKRWEDQYGNISLSESQRLTFDNIVIECMGAKK
jgi:hypothetical protein